MPDTGADWEQRIRERAYFLWHAEGCPEGRSAEFWDRARALEMETAPPTDGESVPAPARTSIRPLDRQHESGARRDHGGSQGLPFRAGPPTPPSGEGLAARRAARRPWPLLTLAVFAVGAIWLMRSFGTDGRGRV
ncbi:DUF2934 domain-containing protein [Dankookia rubra]|uniref:DUF2934 domain-containing protein n=1 Tax=Dankookia rubra TaxID=1442381 RepID=A0A4R5Q8B0_9PROT|nr:DUF2934 domain-containing protein [Dankookia rubra]TDH58347.1 DUF2934 domain-containing protein [Dankookia rubra]